MAITLDYISEIISITSPTTTVTIQELVNTIRESEDDLSNCSFNSVMDGDGKAELDPTTFTAITLTLSDTWQIQFWNGVTLGIIKNGNLVGGVGGQPIKATGGNDTVLVINQVGGTVTVTGSGVTEQDKTDIIDGVWDETTSGHIGVGTTGLKVNNLPSGMTKAKEVLGFSFMMLDTNGNPATGETVSALISKDGNTFNSFTNSVIEISNGFYKINITSIEMDANTIAFVFTATGCRQTNISIITT